MKKIVYVGNIPIGNGHIVIQSMTNTLTKDIDATVKQITELAKHGAEIVRVAVKDKLDAEAIAIIKKKLTFNVPIVADIHYDYKLALLAIQYGADKIRINPGNMPKEHLPIICEKCNEHNIPIRIGVNSGSLSKEIINKYGHTAKALIEEAKKEIALLNQYHFDNIVLSLKATDIKTFIEANIQASQIFPYPLHIGLTESGTILKGSIRSSYAISKLLENNIGDTIRVSLTSDPLNEVIAAKEILKMFDKYNGITLISCPTCGRTEYPMTKIIEELEPLLDQIPVKLTVAIMGCVVNGIGEGMSADLGIAGGKDKAVIFSHGEILKTVDYKEIIPAFIAELNKFK